MKHLTEYSKGVIRLMIVLWFIGAGFGAAVIVVELIMAMGGSEGYYPTITIHLPELLTYIGAPMSCGITGYLLKAGFENREKIRQNGPDSGDS